MKQVILFLAAVFFLFSCKKNKDKHAQPSLVSMEIRDHFMNDVYKTYFEVDNQGRILSIREQKNNNPTELVLTATYNNNEMLVEYAPEPDFGRIFYKSVRYTWGTNGQLEKIIGYRRGVGINQNAGKPDQTEADTTLHEYDAAGFLKRSYLSTFESYPVGLDSFLQQYRTTDWQFTNDGQNLTGSTITGIRFWMDRGPGGVTTTRSVITTEARDQYRYTKAYSNLLKDKNIVLLDEYWHRNLFFYRPTYCNANKNLVDGWDQFWTERDAGGNIYDQYHLQEEFVYTYTASGQLSRIKKKYDTAILLEIDFFYNE